MSGLVLSLFPGIGLLDMAFEDAGFCVVRGPDVIWGGDIRKFHPPAGVFDGVIGGPPCQMFSALAPLVRHNGHEPSFGNLIPEYERCVSEAEPQWFVMEEVRGAPLPEVEGYDRWAELVKDSDVGGAQPRVRRILLGLREGRWQSAASPFTLLEYKPMPVSGASVIAADSGIAYEEARRKQSVSSHPNPHRRWKRSVGFDQRETVPGSRTDDGGGEVPHSGKTLSIEDAIEAQGLPRDHLDQAPFTVDGKRHAIGNGVPLPMGRAIARLVLAVLDG